MRRLRQITRQLYATHLCAGPPRCAHRAPARAGCGWHAPVHDGHAYVTEDAVGGVGSEELAQLLPGMGVRVELVERVLAAVPRHLELGPRAECAARRLCVADRCDDAIEVTLRRVAHGGSTRHGQLLGAAARCVRAHRKVHRPLVQVACRHARKRHGARRVFAQLSAVHVATGPDSREKFPLIGTPCPGPCHGPGRTWCGAGRAS